MAKSKKLFAPDTTPLIGRKYEIKLLNEALTSHDAEFVALYGRRRVGKTYLIRQYLAPRADVYFEVTGQKDQSTARQLHNFKNELERVFYHGVPLPHLQSWNQALDLLASAISNQLSQKRQRIVLFLDELPWLSTRKSGLLSAIDYVWNTRLSRIPSLCLIVCGSAASWMLEKLIQAKGGLHNRTTKRIRLDPFSLAEASEFLKTRRVRSAKSQTLELYMALGGIPYYLKLARPGYSAAQNIAQICFEQSGGLVDEFPLVFRSLFSNSEVHERIVRTLARRAMGILRDELIKDSGLPSGGTLAKRLRELEEAGFIAHLPPYRNKTKQTIYRLIDEYAWFYLKWIQRAPRGVLATGDSSYWLSRRQGPSYHAWSGYAFEAICYKHSLQIQRALGIQTIASEVATWKHIPKTASSQNQGAQIDLLFDRADGIISLCELKYSGESFVLTKRHANELKRKMEIFQRVTKTHKQLEWVLVTTHGLKPNHWAKETINNIVTANDLFHENATVS